MPQPERKDSLQIFTNIRDGTQSACLNPRKFSLSAIRQMLTSQINDRDPSASIVIEAKYGTTHISANEIHQIRKSLPKQQKSFIRKYTKIIGYADRVIFLDCES